MNENWQADLERWLAPYLDRLGNKTRRGGPRTVFSVPPEQDFETAIRRRPSTSRNSRLIFDVGCTALEGFLLTFNGCNIPTKDKLQTGWRGAMPRRCATCV